MKKYIILFSVVKLGFLGSCFASDRDVALKPIVVRPFSSSAHYAYKKTEIFLLNLLYGQSVNVSEDEAKKPFLNSVHWHEGIELSVQTYDLACHDINADPAYIYEDETKREQCKNIALRIVYLPIIMQDGRMLFAEDSGYKKLLDQMKLINKSEDHCFAVVSNDPSDASKYNVAIIKKDTLASADDKTPQSMLSNSELLKETIRTSLSLCLADDMVAHELDILGLEKNKIVYAHEAKMKKKKTYWQRFMARWRKMTNFYIFQRLCSISLYSLAGRCLYKYLAR